MKKQFGKVLQMFAFVCIVGMGGHASGQTGSLNIVRSTSTDFVNWPIYSWRGGSAIRLNSADAMNYAAALMAYMSSDYANTGKSSSYNAYYASYYAYYAIYYAYWAGYLKASGLDSTTYQGYSTDYANYAQNTIASASVSLFQEAAAGTSSFNSGSGFYIFATRDFVASVSSRITGAPRPSLTPPPKPSSTPSPSTQSTIPQNVQNAIDKGYCSLLSLSRRQVMCGSLVINF